MRILICQLVHRQKILAECGSFQLFKSLVIRDICRSHCRRGRCRCLWEVIPLLSGIYCPHLTVASPTRCQVGKPRAVRNIKSLPLINVIMLGNVSAWTILSISYLLICVLSASGRIQTLHVPHVSMATGSNFCPLNKVRYSFQLQVAADAHGACLVCFKICLLLLPNGNRRTKEWI